MKTATEVQLRKAALVLTAIVGLQVLWNGVSLLLLSEPEAIGPAGASLNVDGVRQKGSTSEEASQALVSRPLFWHGRQAYMPPEGSPMPEMAMGPRSSGAIDKVELLGVYEGGAVSGVIVSYKGERRRLQVSDSIEGWELAKLTADGAEFESSGDTRELLLKHAATGARAAPKKDVSRRKISRAEARLSGSANGRGSSSFSAERGIGKETGDSAKDKTSGSKKKASGDSKNKEKSKDKSKKENGKKEKKNGSGGKDKSAGTNNDNTGE